ncbi:MAG TPA: hypothetical protein VFL93_16855 [Longimicrobiaceae bacterium]|nr:hypothetical protein [Longimicrobiaceae bacterium]
MSRVTDVSVNAHLAWQILLLTVALLLACAVAAVVLLILRRRTGLRRVLVAGAGVIGAYLVALLVVSVLSGNRRLQPDTRKYICEPECQLSYSFAGLRTGSLPGTGRVGIVYIRVRSDTASASGSPGLIWPGPRRLRLLDAAGREIAPTSPERVWGVAGMQATLRQPVPPGGAFTAGVPFLMPEGFTPTTVMLTQDAPVTHLLIGNENSPLHGKAVWEIPRTGSPVSARESPAG